MRSYDSHAARPRVLFLGKPKVSGGGIEENQKYFNVDVRPHYN